MDGYFRPKGHGAKPELGGISAERNGFRAPESQLTKHLVDSGVLVISHKNASRSGDYAEIMVEKLEGKTKGHFILEMPNSTAVIYACAQNADIAIIMFYLHNEETVEQLVEELTKANPEMYIVIANVTGTGVKKGLADMVIDKLKITKPDGAEFVEKQLKGMLTNPPLGDSNRRRIIGFEYNGKSFGELSPTAQAAVTKGHLETRFLEGENRTGYRHVNKGDIPGGFVELSANVDPTATVGPDALVLDFAILEPGASVLASSRITGDRVVRNSETVREWR